MDGWYSIYNLLRMRKLFNLPFNKSIMLEKYYMNRNNHICITLSIVWLYTKIRLLNYL